MLLAIFFTITATAQEQRRCKGMTQWGQCTNVAEDGYDYCQLHNTGRISALKSTTSTSKATTRTPKANTTRTTVSVGRCQARTKKGTQCTRKATHGAYCWQHAK